MAKMTLIYVNLRTEWKTNVRDALCDSVTLVCILLSRRMLSGSKREEGHRSQMWRKEEGNLSVKVSRVLCVYNTCVEMFCMQEVGPGLMEVFAFKTLIFMLALTAFE